METTVKRILSGLSGLLVGAVTYYFMYGWYDVFPWAIAALIVGYFSNGRRNCIINGAIFGYFLFLMYIFAGYKGKTGTGDMIKFILFDLLFSLVGGVAGVVGRLWVIGLGRNLIEIIRTVDLFDLRITLIHYNQTQNTSTKTTIKTTSPK